MTTTQPDVRGRIDAVWEQLSPAERRVAAMVHHDPELLLVGTSAQLAIRSSTSKATVSRLVRSLGFQDAAEVRQELMSARGSGLPWAAEDAAHVDQRAVESRNLDAAFASLARADRRDITDRILSAQHVTVIGLRNAYPIALQLRAQLSQLRPHVYLAPSPGQSLGEDIAVGDDDLLIIVSVRRHSSKVPKLIHWAARLRVDTIVIGDPTIAVAAAPARTTILCPVDSPSAFDSLASLAAVITTITNDAYEAAGPSARARIEEIATSYRALNELSDV